MLKPQDVVVAIKLHLMEGGSKLPTFSFLSNKLKISGSEVHAAVKRGLDAGLLIRRPNSSAIPKASPLGLEEFVNHGLRYVWPAKTGAIARGLVTATSVQNVADSLGVPVPEALMVWKHSGGEHRGESVTPLYPRAVDACMEDSQLHEWLALVDVVRIRRGRELELARFSISKLLGRAK